MYGREAMVPSGGHHIFEYYGHYHSTITVQVTGTDDGRDAHDVAIRFLEEVEEKLKDQYVKVTKDKHEVTIHLHPEGFGETEEELTDTRMALNTAQKLVVGVRIIMKTPRIFGSNPNDPMAIVLKDTPETMAESLDLISGLSSNAMSEIKELISRVCIDATLTVPVVLGLQADNLETAVSHTEEAAAYVEKMNQDKGYLH